MKKIVFLILFNVVFSCNSSKNLELKGIYEKHGKDYIYNLEIDSDKSFLLSKKYYEINASCKGIWTTKNDTLILKCSDEEFPAQITAGYMNQRKYKVLILNEKELNLDNIVLTRK